MGVTAFISSFVLIFSLLFPILGQAQQRNNKMTQRSSTNQVMVPRNMPAWIRLTPSKSSSQISRANKKFAGDDNQRVEFEAGAFEIKPEKNLEISKMGRINYQDMIKLSKEHIRDQLGDDDGDGVNNDADNCRSVSNARQTDSDGDGLGNACDNCAGFANPYQEDQDSDGTGNLCDDSDGDGIMDDEDNCIDVANADQADVNGNGIGDECDAACPDPDFDLEVTEARCRYHRGDKCEWYDLNGCDPGFDDGDIVVTSGHYVVAWHTEKVDYVTEDCHNYLEDTAFSEDLGTVSFHWDGPLPGDDEPFGFTSASLENWWPDIELIRSAWAGGAFSDRHGGRFDCRAVAHGRCGKTITRSFWYSCP